MKVLIVGAGVVGTVYGAHLGAAGSTSRGAKPWAEDR